MFTCIAARLPDLTLLQKNLICNVCISTQDVINIISILQVYNAVGPDNNKSLNAQILCIQ